MISSVLNFHYPQEFHCSSSFSWWRFCCLLFWCFMKKRSVQNCVICSQVSPWKRFSTVVKSSSTVGMHLHSNYFIISCWCQLSHLLYFTRSMPQSWGHDAFHQERSLCCQLFRGNVGEACHQGKVKKTFIKLKKSKES